ncbi:MAG: hypothetical protein QOE58_222, partial [Actinomycetota bacterium]|nr:hypothetical protein [Actinomycetota bacterium]
LMPKAFVFNEYGGPQVQALVDVPKPASSPGQLVVAVRAAGVNPVDWKIREGYLRDFVPITPPVVPGSELAGVVEEVGEGVEGFATGDEVFGGRMLGAFAEYAVVPADALAPKPPAVSFTTAATLPIAAGAAYDALDQLDLAPGQTLLILGAGGGVGTAATQLARSRGINVIGTASEQKRDLVETLGAVHVVYGEDVVDRIRVLAPHGVDAILDLVGPPDVERTAELLTERSKLMTTVDPATASKLGGTSVQRVLTGERYAILAKLAEEGVLDPIVKTLPLERAAEALAELQNGHAKGKLVLEVT